MKKVLSGKEKREQNLPVNKRKAAAASGASAKSEETSKVTSNARLVDALRGYETSKEQAKSYLVDVATIVQEEQLTKEEVVVSMMEARGIDRKTAGEQYSRMKKLINDPETLQELRDGIIDLKEARARVAKPQANPSEKKKSDNAEKTIGRAVGTIMTKAKETGMDLASIINMIKTAAKKAGLK